MFTIQFLILILIGLTVTSFKVYFTAKYELGDEVPLFVVQYIALCLMETLTFAVFINEIINFHEYRKAMLIIFGTCIALDVKNFFLSWQTRTRQLDKRKCIVKVDNLKSADFF
jgi:hypothetical protein